MLSALSVDDVLELSRLADARARDNRAMQRYLGYGEYIIASTLASVAEAGAFDCPEHYQLQEKLAEVGEVGRLEVTALILIARGDRTLPAAALAHARSMTDADRMRYIMAKPLHAYLPVALRRLGILPPGMLPPE
jgi:hypothetical protein